MYLYPLFSVLPFSIRAASDSTPYTDTFHTVDFLTEHLLPSYSINVFPAHSPIYLFSFPLACCYLLTQSMLDDRRASTRRLQWAQCRNVQVARIKWTDKFQHNYKCINTQKIIDSIMPTCLTNNTIMLVRAHAHTHTHTLWTTEHPLLQSCGLMV